jgi:hypothetical protein
VKCNDLRRNRKTQETHASEVFVVTLIANLIEPNLGFCCHQQPRLSDNSEPAVPIGATA